MPRSPLYADPYTPSSPSARSLAGSGFLEEVPCAFAALTQHAGSWLQKRCLGPLLFLLSAQPGWAVERPGLRCGVGQGTASLSGFFKPGQSQRGTGFPCLITACQRHSNPRESQELQNKGRD